MQNKARNQKSGEKDKAGEDELDVVMKASMLPGAIYPYFKQHCK